MFIEKLSKVKLNLSETEKTAIGTTLNVIDTFCAITSCELCPLSHTEKCLKTDNYRVLERMMEKDVVQENDE